MGQVNRRAFDRVFVTGHPESIGEDDLGDSAGEYITIYAPTPEEAWARGGSLCPKGIDNSTMLASQPLLPRARPLLPSPCFECVADVWSAHTRNGFILL